MWQIRSGASNTVISRLCLRKLGLLGWVQETSAIFVNVDGFRGKANGVIRGLILATPDMRTTVDAYVSDALNYSVLLGTDFLFSAQASLCYATQWMYYLVDDNSRSSIPSLSTARRRQQWHSKQSWRDHV